LNLSISIGSFFEGANIQLKKAFVKGGVRKNTILRKKNGNTLSSTWELTVKKIFL